MILTKDHGKGQAPYRLPGLYLHIADEKLSVRIPALERRHRVTSTTDTSRDSIARLVRFRSPLCPPCVTLRAPTTSPRLDLVKMRCGAPPEIDKIHAGQARHHAKGDAEQRRVRDRIGQPGRRPRRRYLAFLFTPAGMYARVIGCEGRSDSTPLGNSALEGRRDENPRGGGSRATGR